MRRNLLLRRRLILALTPPVTIKTGIAEIRATVEVYLLQINCHLLHLSLLQLDRLKISTYQMTVNANISFPGFVMRRFGTYRLDRRPFDLILRVNMLSKMLMN